jgi:uncharacterized protein YjbI with pentapeptide repeats
MVDRPPQPADDDNANAQHRRRVIWSLVGAGLLVLGLLLACVLWIPRSLYPSLTETDLRGVSDAAKVQELKGARLKLQNDARTTLLQGLGAVLVLIGASIGASVTLRQVRATRDQIRETATASRNQLKLSEQGQVTDRYTRAVEQLGHEKAPVRLGALYSLDHLAQDNPEYRHTVVDVVCAYLRMPYTLPAQPELDAEQVGVIPVPARGHDRAPHPAPGQDPTQEELQVRQTAQRLLANHLRCPPRTSGQEAQLLPSSPQQAFWPGISLDLTGATLVDFDFARISVIQVQFAGATFEGKALFNRAVFEVLAWFGEATFKGGAWFGRATFQSDAWFGRATFQSDAMFGEATFKGSARFDGATFQVGAWFDGATFQGDAWFGRATFQGRAGFGGATFQSDALFGEATFQVGAMFGGATFQGGAGFGGATFQGGAGFGGATFQGAVAFNAAHALHFDDPNMRRVWPDGWAVRPDPTDPSRGTLVPAGQAKEPEPALPPSDHTDNP